MTRPHNGWKTCALWLRVSGAHICAFDTKTFRLCMPFLYKDNPHTISVWLLVMPMRLAGWNVERKVVYKYNYQQLDISQNSDTTHLLT